MDIVIPLGENDIDTIQRCINSCKTYIKNSGQIYVISYDEYLVLEGCTVIPEFMIEETNHILKRDEDRNKWYAQQLMKLYAFTKIPTLTDDYLVVDADTIFCKPIEFISEEGKYYFQTGKIYKDLFSYFPHMNAMHPSLKDAGYNFIHHQMIFNKNRLQELFQIVGDYHKKPFWRVFLENIKYYYYNGASEYQIYATFMYTHHPDKMLLRNLKYKQNVVQIDTNKEYYWVNNHWVFRHLLLI